MIIGEKRKPATLVEVGYFYNKKHPGQTAFIQPIDTILDWFIDYAHNHPDEIEYDNEKDVFYFKKPFKTLL